MRKKVSQNETPQDLLENYRSRIAIEGWLKAALCGASVGFGADILCAFAFWVFGIKLFWVCILVFAAVTAIAMPLFYFCRFKNSRSQVASRIDMLGLEERILTMTQFENDDSYMARRQREDAMNALRSVNASFVKIAVSASMVVTCCVALVLGAGATAASAVADKSLLDLIREKQEEREAPANTFLLTYGVKDSVGGRVDGELKQTVKEGAGAGADSASNPVIDGSTYYGDEYSGSLSDAQNSMNSDSNLSGDDKGVIGDYFHNIQK